MGRRSRKHRFPAVSKPALAVVPDLRAADRLTTTNSSNGGPSSALDFDPALEYVAGYGQSFSVLERQIPTQARDPKAPEVTFETYRQMINDPEVGSNIRTLVNMALGDGIQLAPAADGKPVDEDAPEYEQAFEIAQFCERAMMHLRKPLEDSLEGIVEGALVYGHKTAEITWKVGTGPDANRLILDRLAQKDYRTLDLVVDQFWNLLGFIPRTPARSISPQTIIPREKFFHLALHEEDEDPRGRSSIRSSYTAWMFKCLTWPEYKRWLDNCALPSTVGILAPRQPGDVQRNTDGTTKTGAKQLSPSEAFGEALAQLKNAGYLVIPNGAEVEQLEVSSEGTGFERAINVADSQMSKGILHQMLATSEAQFGTRAQSETHMGVLDLLVWWLKGKVAKAIKADLVYKIILYNFGDKALRFCPDVSLGDTERRDWAQDASAASLIEPAITDSQWLSVTDQLGLPAPLPGEEPRRNATVLLQQPAAPAQKQKQATESGSRRYRPRSGAFVTLQVRRGN